MRFKVLFLLNFLPSAPAGTETEGPGWALSAEKRKKIYDYPFTNAVRSAILSLVRIILNYLTISHRLFFIICIEQEETIL